MKEEQKQPFNHRNKTSVSATPAYLHLLSRLKEILTERHHRHGTKPVILNIGAGRSDLIEKRLAESGIAFECDRIDIEKTDLTGPFIRNSYQCSVENMYPLKSGQYDAAFANYVLEHVKDLDKSASEIFRALKPGGVFIASVPNPTAPEIIVSRITPLWVHKLIAGRDAYDTHYSFNTIAQLRGRFERHGFKTQDVNYSSYLYGYMERLRVLKSIAALYDRMLNTLKIKRLMDYVCVIFQKP